MVHKTSLIPGLSKFIDSSILAQYPPTSMKRIIGAGALSLYLNQSNGSIDNFLSALGLVSDDNMVKLESARDVLKNEITKAGFMRIHLPILGDVDFTSEDVDKLYQDILSIDAAVSTSSIPSPITPHSMT